MEELFEKIDGLRERMDALEGLDLAGVQELLDQLQDCFLDALGCEPRKGQTAAKKKWKAHVKELKSLVEKAEERERLLYERRFPKLRHYCGLIDQEREDMEWLDLKDEVEDWLKNGSQELRDEFAASGYQDELEERCRGLSRPEGYRKPDKHWLYSPVPIFSRYLPLLYAVDDLWEMFSHYMRQTYSLMGRKAEISRDPKTMKEWHALLDNMGGGLPLSLFASGAFLLLRYQDMGHDLDNELSLLKGTQWDVGGDPF